MTNKYRQSKLYIWRKKAVKASWINSDETSLYIVYVTREDGIVAIIIRLVHSTHFTEQYTISHDLPTWMFDVITRAKYFQVCISMDLNISLVELSGE